MKHLLRFSLLSLLLIASWLMVGFLQIAKTGIRFTSLGDVVAKAEVPVGMSSPLSGSDTGGFESGAVGCASSSSDSGDGGSACSSSDY